MVVLTNMLKTVDWIGGRAVVGENESEILTLLRQVGESDVD